MGYPEGHKEKTRQKIVDAARKMWKTKGYAGASVDHVMKEAGLTRGGFYAHFKSKDDLFATALDENLVRQGLSKMETLGIPAPDAQKKWVLDWYLGQFHRDNPEAGCPLTALAQETPRLGGRPREVLSSMIQRFGRWLGGEQANDRGLAAISLMVGAITLARATEDKDLSDRILKESRLAINDLLEKDSAQ